MTREEEIQKLIDEENGIDNYGSADYQVGVCDGVRLADANPKSPWISIDDDLPCNHKELIDREIPTYTPFVVVRLKDGTVASARMVKIPDGNWVWPFKVSHWFPIPELPKE